jgi:hypothetical protein
LAGSDLLSPVPFHLVMCNAEGQRGVLVPNYPVTQPPVSADPFSTHLEANKGDKEWAANVESRTFFYPVHTSSYMLHCDSFRGALHLLSMRLLHRDYLAILPLLPYCRVDGSLTSAELFHLNQIQASLHDKAPDAHAVRLHLLLALSKVPDLTLTWFEPASLNRPSARWNFNDELSSYFAKRAHVHRDLLLSLAEERELIEAGMQRKDENSTVKMLYALTSQTNAPTFTVEGGRLHFVRFAIPSDEPLPLPTMPGRYTPFAVFQRSLTRITLPTTGLLCFQQPDKPNLLQLTKARGIRHLARARGCSGLANTLACAGLAGRRYAWWQQKAGLRLPVPYDDGCHARIAGRWRRQ